MNKNIFIDESGNTGPNYIDKNEKYFVLAGWLDINNIASKSAKMSKLTSLLEQKEGKNKILLNSVKGRNIISNVIEFMINEGCKPFLAIANKRYCVSARIVEVLMDPCYNDKMPKWFENYNKIVLVMKKSLANFFYELSDEVLSNFAIAYRGDDMTLDERIQKMKISIDEIADELVNEKELAQIIKNSKFKIKENITIGQDSDKYSMGAMQAPNTWIANNLFQMLELNAKKNGYLINVIHDKNKYEKYLVEMLQRQSENNQEYYGGVQTQHISKIEFIDSNIQLMIQAADILAGAVNYTLKDKAKNKWKVDRSTENIIHNVLPFIMDNEVTFFMGEPLEDEKLLNAYEMHEYYNLNVSKPFN